MTERTGQSRAVTTRGRYSDGLCPAKSGDAVAAAVAELSATPAASSWLGGRELPNADLGAFVLTEKSRMIPPAQLQLQLQLTRVFNFNFNFMFIVITWTAADASIPYGNRPAARRAKPSPARPPARRAKPKPKALYGRLTERSCSWRQTADWWHCVKR